MEPALSFYPCRGGLYALPNLQHYGKFRQSGQTNDPDHG